MTTSLAFTHLRFDCLACSPIKLGGYQAGERLRDALASVMLRAVCPEMQRGEKPTPQHAAGCPACWLLAADTDPGNVRRAYTLAPPLPQLDLVPAGGRFSFVLTLFGKAAGPQANGVALQGGGWQYLPYFVLAVPAMGEIGVGPGGGKFALEAIWALDPLNGQAEAVLRPGEAVVYPPQGRVDWVAAQAAAEAWAPALVGCDLRLRFLTPTRLIEGEALVKEADFGVFFQRLLQRIDAVAQQYTGEARRPPEEVVHLHALADRVRLVRADTEWVDLWAPSGRTGRRTPMGGLVGTAEYRARDWAPLLPWLIFGQGVQAGKLVVKGNGVFAVDLPAVAPHRADHYWQRIYTRTAGVG